MMVTDWIVRLCGCNKITGNQWCALVYQLIKSMLSIGAWFSPDYWTCRISNCFPISIYTFAITFHISLLEISRKPVHVLIVWKDGLALCTKKINVPKADQCKQYRNVFFKISILEMFISRMCAFQ